MCRFALYLGPEMKLSTLVTEPGHSIVHQSYHAVERTEPLNGDGFGVCWYVPALSQQPALFKSVSPAWSNRNLKHLARVTTSSCILAHVRAATSGLPVNRENCHPFTHGIYSFMHNGSIAGFPTIKRELQNRLSDETFATLSGSTDSEHLFGLVLDNLDPTEETAAADGMADALAKAIFLAEALRLAAGIAEPSYLNLVLTDGQSAAVSRYISEGSQKKAASLYVHTGRSYACENGICRMIEAEREKGAVLIASEPLSDDPGWDPIPPNQTVKVYPDRSTSLQTIEAAKALQGG